MEEEDSIIAEAAARRERLKALRTAQELLSTPDQDDQEDVDSSRRNQNASDNEGIQEHNGEEQEENNVNMKFRNYLPHDKKLQERKLAPPVLPKFEDPVATEASQEEKKEDPFLNIAPKKPNWDLKRDVQKKLDKLDKRTLKAMYKLLAEEERNRRLADEGEGEGEVEAEEV